MCGQYRQTKRAPTNQLSGRGIFVVGIRSSIEPDLFDNNVLFDNTTPIYLICLLWKLGLGLGLDLQLHYFRIFAENNENEHLIFRELTGNILLKERTHLIDTPFCC